MFRESGIQSEFMNEFYIMDVIINRAPSPAVTGNAKTEGKDDCQSADVDFDVVPQTMLYSPDDNGPGKDYLYRGAAILFLSQCAVFYCHRERCSGDVGLPGRLIAHDASWLCLQKDEKTCPIHLELTAL
jgi:hypothetical protein